MKRTSYLSRARVLVMTVVIIQTRIAFLAYRRVQIDALVLFWAHWTFKPMAILILDQHDRCLPLFQIRDVHQERVTFDAKDVRLRSESKYVQRDARGSTASPFGGNRVSEQEDVP